MEDADLPAVVERLGLPGLFDVHVHFMPPEILRRVWAYFDAAGPLLGREWPIRYRESDEERVARLRAMGVRRFSALSYAHRPGVATFMNDWTREFARRVPEALWSGTFYPEPDAADYVGALVDGGVEVMKAHLQVGEFAADDPMLDGVWAVVQAARVPVVLHAGSGPVPGRHTGPGGVTAVLDRFPDLTLVIAHLGAPETVAFLDLAARYHRVYLDTTMVFTDFAGSPTAPDDVADRLARQQDRILFGTDFPNIPYPYAHQVEVLDALGLGDDWLRAVLWDNAERLFETCSARCGNAEERSGVEPG